MFSPEFLVFLEKWQTLIGSAAGSFLAVIFSAIGFWLKGLIDERNERRETGRRIEIGITRSINDLDVAREQVRSFLAGAKKLVSEIKSITDDKTFVLERINFPVIREVYKDVEGPNFRVKSYYLHNNLLFSDAYIKQFNETMLGFKSDYQEMLKQNEFLVVLKDSPKNQRTSYAENLEQFSEAISKYTDGTTSVSIKMLMYMKVYNQKLREHPIVNLWKYEGITFKYFENVQKQKEYSRNLDSFDRIEKILKGEVDTEIEKANKKKILEN